jgi:hypothetical protein
MSSPRNSVSSPAELDVESAELDVDRLRELKEMRIFV